MLNPENEQRDHHGCGKWRYRTYYAQAYSRVMHIERKARIVIANEKHRHNKSEKMGSDTNGAYLSGSIIDVGWVRHAVCAVTRQMCRQALNKKCVVLLRNAWWVTQKTLTHPTFSLSKCHSGQTLMALG